MAFELIQRVKNMTPAWPSGAADISDLASVPPGKYVAEIMNGAKGPLRLIRAPIRYDKFSALLANGMQPE